MTDCESEQSSEASNSAALVRAAAAMEQADIWRVYAWLQQMIRTSGERGEERLNQRILLRLILTFFYDETRATRGTIYFTTYARAVVATALTNGSSETSESKTHLRERSSRDLEVRGSSLCTNKNLSALARYLTVSSGHRSLAITASTFETIINLQER